jgi:hypothetical protein
MSILTKFYTKSNNYNLSLAGIVPAKGFYQTTITGTHFISGDKPEAPKIKITDKSYKTITWAIPKGDPTKKQLTLQGIKEVKNTEIPAPPALKLVGTKSTPAKKAPALKLVGTKKAPAVLATAQRAETNETTPCDSEGSSDSDDTDPDHIDYIKKLRACSARYRRRIIRGRV